MKDLIYTGVGPRNTPAPMLVLMEALGMDLRERGYTLRSGHADGADYAFECGAHGDAEIYLPWKTFNGPLAHVPTKYVSTGPSDVAKAIAATLHPAWHHLGHGGRLLHARNVHQVLGADCETKSAFLLCWTTGGRVTGGTATAIRLATIKHIPVYNLWFAHDRARFETELNLPVVV